jgi:FKBP-type peptidyl-prolyl cis-trans isomerase
MIGHLEVLESRRLLTNVVAVTVKGGAVTLNDVSAPNTSTGDSFNISYTGTQFVLTGNNNTMFRVNGTDQATYTATVTSPLSLNMSLSSQANTVTVTGDGTADLTSLNVNLGNGKANNSLTLTKLVADSVNVHGGRGSENVTFSQSTINQNLNVNLRQQNGDVFELLNTTVKGNVVDFTGQLILNTSTITGTLQTHQNSREANWTSTDSTYTGAVTAWMGKDAVIMMHGSSVGPSHFHSALNISGPHGNKPTLYEATNSIVTDVAPKLQNVNVRQLTATFTAPTVASQISATATPKITGTFDTHATRLSVTANGKTYTLGTDSQLTAPTAGNWSLDLTGAPLTTATNTVTASSFDNVDNILSGTGTVTNEQAIISSFVTNSSLATPTVTASGLNYIVTTPGTGAVPTNGQSVTVNYTGHLLKADGTQGAEFDSNIDPLFNHVTPFTFVLGKGSVIKGWDEAFALLKVGSVAKLIIPSSLAYGPSGSAQGTVPIPANSILIFDVTLVSAV